MTTLELISRLNYLLGRFEGIASVLPESQQTALLDTCEWLTELIGELEPKETVSAKDVMDGKKAYPWDSTLTGSATVSAKPNPNITVTSYNAELTCNSVDPNKPTATITSPFGADEWEALKKELGVDTMCEVKP